MRNVSEKPIRILCIDDEICVLNALKRTFRGAPFEAYYTVDLDRAYKFYTERKPDLVISDYKMPGLNGAQLIKELCNERQGVPWIILSGYSPDEAIERLADSGLISEFVSKPWSKQKLLQIINNLTR